MRMYALLVGVSLVALPLAAQGPAPVGLQQPHAIMAGVRWTPSFAADSVSGSHWKEGMIIGLGTSVGLWLLLTMMYHSGCFGSEPGCGAEFSRSLRGFAIFGLVGGLIGLMIPKG